MIKKAIIPVAGWGTRRLPITKIIEKSMLPVGNRPLVDYSVQELISAGIKEIYMVISNVEPCQVKGFYQRNLALDAYLEDRGKSDRLSLAHTLPDDVTIHYVTQDPSGKYGTAVPVALVAEQFSLQEPVLVFMGDDFIWNPGGQSSVQSLLVTMQSPDDSVVLGVEVPHSEVSKYGVLSVSDGLLTDIVEKPSLDSAPSNLISVSKYIFSPALLSEIVDYVKNNNFGPRDPEYYVCDPIKSYLAHGGVMRVATTDGEYLDGGSLEGWVHANNVVCGSSAK